MTFRELDEYAKDLKKLSKRFRSLQEDIATLKKVLEIQPEPTPPMSVRIAGLETGEIVVKVRKIACKSLKGRGASSGMRLIYHYDKENVKIALIELYFKGDKENEDRERIVQYLKTFQKGK